MLDIFQQDAFNVLHLTHAIQTFPYEPEQIGRAGYFTAEGIDSIYVTVERFDNKIGLVAYTPRGGPGETIAHERGNLRVIQVPHLQRDDAVNADEVQGWRRRFTENETETVRDRLVHKTRRHIRDLEATIEQQRVGALSGRIYDKHGGLIMDLFSQFDITEPAPFVFSLNDAEANLQTQARAIRYSIEDILDAPYRGIDVWCGRDFWSALQDHPWFSKIYIADQQGRRLMGDPDPDVFVALDMTFRRYVTGKQVTAANGGNPFIASDEARLVLTGVNDLYHSVFAPGDYIETVNLPGLPRYMKQWERPNGKAIEFEVQSNPLSYCTRPELLFKMELS